MPGRDAEPTPRSIARDLAEYLREVDGVCAEGNVNGWRWVRHQDGEWQATAYASGHSDRLKSYVRGEMLCTEDAIDWLEAKPVKIIPQSEAYLWGPSTETVWEDGDRQDVFEPSDRCFWCGESENEQQLESFETYDHGEISLCNDCEESWRSADEIVEQEAQTA